MKLSRSVGPFYVFGILASVLLFTLLGCDSPPEFLSKSDQESLTKLRSGKYTLISNQELSSMQQEVDAVKNSGRYHIFRGGAHTWRLDTDSGQVCLLMAPADDWIKPEMKAQSCASIDASMQRDDKGKSHSHK